MVAADWRSLMITFPEFSTNSLAMAGVMFQYISISPKMPGPLTRLYHTHTHTHHLVQQLTEMTTTTTKILGGEVVPYKSCAIVHSLRFSDKYIPGRVSNANDAQSSTVSPNHNCGQV